MNQKQFSKNSIEIWCIFLFVDFFFFVFTAEFQPAKCSCLSQKDITLFEEYRWSDARHCISSNGCGEHTSQDRGPPHGGPRPPCAGGEKASRGRDSVPMQSGRQRLEGGMECVMLCLIFFSWQVPVSPLIDVIVNETYDTMKCVPAMAYLFNPNGAILGASPEDLLKLYRFEECSGGWDEEECWEARFILSRFIFVLFSFLSRTYGSKYPDTEQTLHYLLLRVQHGSLDNSQLILLLHDILDVTLPIKLPANDPLPFALSRLQEHIYTSEGSQVKRIKERGSVMF